MNLYILATGDLKLHGKFGYFRTQLRIYECTTRVHDKMVISNSEIRKHHRGVP